MAMTRMVQNKYTGPIRPVVKLVSHTEDPIGTIFTMWWGSRHEKLVNAAEIEHIYHSYLSHDLINEYRPLMLRICEAYPEYAGKDGTDYKNVIRSIVNLVLRSDLPPAESVLFTFEVDKASVAWREQLVRSRVAGYWTQTSRTFDLSSMDVNMADSVSLLGGPAAVRVYKDTVETIRESYTMLSEMGVPVEDIRLQPQAQVHRVYWMINLRQLLKVLNKRSDWIAQASLWMPIMSGIMKTLRENSVTYPFIKDLIGKPDVEISRNGGNLNVVSHKYDIENEDRYFGRDPQPCDPLWLAYKGYKMPEHTNREFYAYLKSMYLQIWNDDIIELLQWDPDREYPDINGPYDI